MLNSFCIFIVEFAFQHNKPKYFLMKMLNYVKKILTRVSFDARLFEKELRKAIKMLIAEEVLELRNWCYANYEAQYGAILNRCFVVA